MENLNHEVSIFLDAQNHSFRNEIEQLRLIILGAIPTITENIKWNSPNYCFNGEDRITMRIQPPKQLQLIFHCGAKVKEQPKEKLLQQDFGLLAWKSNDRAVATFKNRQDLESNSDVLRELVKAWIAATS